MVEPEIEARSGPDQLEQLRFLHQVARLATTARTWDELLETVVDGTRDALHADVTSLYLLDRDGAYLTLAATNGLDRYQIGRARVPFGEGVTGRVAASREPLVIPDVRSDPRFPWVRGIDRRAQRQAWHDAAMEQVERLDRLVDSILASVRIVPAEAAEVSPTDVEATVAEVVASIRPIVRQHHLDVRPGTSHHAMADAPRLRQILEHLIENAVKYAPPETTITIDHALVEGFVRIGVTDQGPGVPEEWRERIFEPYARRETHTARGSGIGLYAAKRLGESMGARLWVEPAEPTGARFVVALPAAAAV